ncbi:MAG TPA: hypothetical protein VF267_12045 [Gammaproteobacteria bacterium]
MLNVHKLFPVRGVVTAALLVSMAFVTVQAEDNSGKKAAPAFDMSAKMQKKLNAKLNGKLDTDKTEAPGFDSNLSSRVEEKGAAVNEKLAEQASAATSAQRGEEKKEEKQAEAAGN